MLPEPPVRIATRSAVWEQYAQARSIRAVARRLGLSAYQVKSVLESDPERLLGIIQEFCEEQIAHWENKHERIHGLLDLLMDFWEAMLLEIRTAANEGRVTSIRNEAGEPMPVLDAVQFLIMSRLLDQARGMAETAIRTSLAYRTAGAVGGADGEGGRDPLSTKALELLDDAELAKFYLDAGTDLPPYLAKKVELLAQEKAPPAERPDGATTKEKKPRAGSVKPTRGGGKKTKVKAGAQARKKQPRKSGARQSPARRKKGKRAKKRGSGSK